ncbi:MAG: bifunctional diaminohydroxyphosphoribosylaminopyrimidine deaminase/5-amino-6-(5-phosphoribosylamino)uracil reductase RibD [Rhizobiaceae bacterium]|nr:bifunctional diaminohydroxyphosphoribosylaminopyrimidine deaminase/5-amino-6-(5-phosphoribosylamino)uracil reductase RibD [Rhizobiaceae bacterium]
MTANGKHNPKAHSQNEKIHSDQEYIDRKFMQAAIRYARRHEGLTAENPSVAAFVIKLTEDQPVIIGRGVTALGGRPHAEVQALEEAGATAKGADVYVTLEPCSHYGKTPPCADALIKAGVKRVIVAADDPDERVAGQGFAKLRAAGIEVVEKVLAREAEYGLAGYLKRKRQARPFVTLKMAMTKDGYIGAHSGEQVKITGAVSNGQVQILRAINDAILVGAGTVENDNPTLTCRLNGLEHCSPVRVVLDRSLKTPVNSNLVQTADQHKLVIATKVDHSSVDVYKKHGAEFLHVSTDNDDAQLSELLSHLAASDISTLLVEGGAKIATSFIKAGFVDRIILFQSNTNLDVKEDAMKVKAPLTPDNMPHGFALKNKLTLGADLMYEYEKIN